MAIDVYVPSAALHALSSADKGHVKSYQEPIAELGSEPNAHAMLLLQQSYVVCLHVSAIEPSNSSFSGQKRHIGRNRHHRGMGES